ncbi:ornithine cyclodeaminase family protein [Streptomyces sp. NPDC059578]|uniref:ornithine cyclodeaminase family protein n=1 Tax=Streptomyces sp. NPDC059578 TaxID=3346874 RepID=UPI00367538BD
MSAGWAPRVIDGPELERDELLHPVINALRHAFRALRAGQAQTAPRTLLQTGHEPPNQLLVSPAAWEQRGVAGLKITTLTPDNPSRGLPLIHGIVALVDLETGRVTALLEGGALTAVRTGAVAGLATQLCAPPDAGDLAIIGAGVQAHALLRTMAAVRPVRSVRLYSRTRERAEAFGEWIQARMDPRTAVVVCDDARTAVRDAEIICTATSTVSNAPLIEADWVAAGAHLNVIGGTHEDAVEVSPELLPTAFVVVEQQADALEEAGEVRAAIANGLIDTVHLHDLAALIEGEAAPKPGQTTLFRGVGLAIEDTAAAAAVYDALCGAP